MEFQLSCSKSWRWCCESVALNMPANLEISAVATGLEKVTFHSNAKECSNYHTIALISHAQNSPSQASAIHEPWTSRWITINCGKSSRDGNTRPLTCLLRNLYASQEATVRTRHGPTDWFQIGKGVRQGCILPPFLFNFYAEYIMRNAGLDEAQARIKIAGRTINNLMTPPFWRKVKKN